MFKNVASILIFTLIVWISLEILFLILKKDFGIIFDFKKEIFITKNGGESWEKIPLKSFFEKGAFAFHPETGNLWALFSNGIFEFKERGLELKKNPFKKNQARIILNFIFHPQIPQFSFILVREIGKDKVLLFEENKSSLSEIFVLSQDKITAFSPDTILPNTIYLGTKLGNFFLSKDLGKSWILKAKFEGEIEKIFPTNLGKIYFLIKREGEKEILVTQDQGNSFSNFLEEVDFKEQNLPSKIEKIKIDPEGKIYLLSQNNLFLIEGKKGNLIFSSLDKISTFTIDQKNSKIYIGGKKLFVLEKEGEKMIELPKASEIKEIKINDKDPKTFLLIY